MIDNKFDVDITSAWQYFNEQIRYLIELLNLSIWSLLLETDSIGIFSLLL